MVSAPPRFRDAVDECVEFIVNKVNENYDCNHQIIHHVMSQYWRLVVATEKGRAAAHDIGPQPTDAASGRDAEPNTKRKPKPKHRLTPRQWIEAEELWGLGEITLNGLCEKYGLQKAAYLRHFKKVGITKGSLAKNAESEMRETIRATLTEESANRVAEPLPPRKRAAKVTMQLDLSQPTESNDEVETQTATSVDPAIADIDAFLGIGV